MGEECKPVTGVCINAFFPPFSVPTSQSNSIIEFLFSKITQIIFENNYPRKGISKYPNTNCQGHQYALEPCHPFNKQGFKSVCVYMLCECIANKLFLTVAQKIHKIIKLLVCSASMVWCISTT